MYDWRKMTVLERSSRSWISDEVANYHGTHLLTSSVTASINTS